jgi:hypothetical protein
METVPYHPYRARQVMDGDVLIGTIERDHEGHGKGFTATLEATGETRWFRRSDNARNWINEQRGEMQQSDQLEQAFSLRFQWDGYE